MRRLFGCFLFVCILLGTDLRLAHAQSLLDNALFRQEAKKGLDLLYNMKYEAADSVFTQIGNRHPNHPVGPFLDALSVWWVILTDLSDTSHDDEFMAAMDKVIERSDRLIAKDKDVLDAMYLKGAALGFRARLRADREQWVKAAWDGKKAMNYVMKVAEMDPEHEDFYFGKGIYDYYAEAAPQEYSVLKPLMIFFPDGDKKRGISLLERTVQNGFFARAESAYFLLQIFYMYEKDYSESVKYARWLRREYPDNAVFHLLEGRVYAKWAQWRKAREAFRTVINRYQKRQTGYTHAIAEQAYYFMGRIHMRFDSYDKALTYLQEVKEISEGNNRETYFSVYGRLRAGMALDALGQRRQARQYYREVLRMKNHKEVHHEARRYLKEPYTASDG